MAAIPTLFQRLPLEHNLIKRRKKHMTVLQSFCQSDTFHDSFGISLLRAAVGMLQVGGKGTFLIKSLNLCSDFRSQSSFSEFFQEEILPWSAVFSFNYLLLVRLVFMDLTRLLPHPQPLIQRRRVGSTDCRSRTGTVPFRPSPGLADGFRSRTPRPTLLQTA